MYVVTYGSDLEVFISINERWEMTFCVVIKYINRKTEIKMKHNKAFWGGPYDITK